MSGALCQQVLDLQEQTLLQRRYLTADPHAPYARYSASWGSLAALPERRIAVGCGEGLHEGEACVSMYEMGMARAELARTGDLELAEQAPRTVLHAHARHPERYLCVRPLGSVFEGHFWHGQNELALCEPGLLITWQPKTV